MSVKNTITGMKKREKTLQLLCCRITSMWRSANYVRIGTDITRKVPRPSRIP